MCHTPKVIDECSRAVYCTLLHRQYSRAKVHLTLSHCVDVVVVVVGTIVLARHHLADVVRHVFTPDLLSPIETCRRSHITPPTEARTIDQTHIRHRAPPRADGRIFCRS